MGDTTGTLIKAKTATLKVLEHMAFQAYMATDNTTTNSEITNLDLTNKCANKDKIL